MLKGRVWIFSFLFLLDSNMDKLTGAGARRWELSAKVGRETRYKVPGFSFGVVGFELRCIVGLELRCIVGLTSVLIWCMMSDIFSFASWSICSDLCLFLNSGGGLIAEFYVLDKSLLWDTSPTNILFLSIGIPFSGWHLSEWKNVNFNKATLTWWLLSWTVP
jgi:hypothetical protein